MKVTIVGSGHGGCALGAVLAMKGHEVSILKLGTTIHNENYEQLKAKKEIRLSGIEGVGCFPLRTVTREAEEVIPNAQLIFICYVSNFHKVIAERICPYLRSNQIVALAPGYLGGLILERELMQLGMKSIPLFVEFETLPYTSRILEPGLVHISSRNVRHPLSAYPASRSREVVERLGSVLGKCTPRNHIIEVALHNPNLVIHTIGVLMNVSWIENKEKSFAMYKDGFSPSMWNLVNKLDCEKMDVLERLGAPRLSYFEVFVFRTFEDLTVDPMKGFSHYAGEAPDGPFNIDNRYVTEDVPMGLGLLYSLGKKLDILTPICESLINLADAFLPEYDVWGKARTIDSIWEGEIEDLLKKVIGL